MVLDQTGTACRNCTGGADSSPRLRVLLADGLQITREGLRGCLAASSLMDLVGEAADVSEACARVQSLNPDLVILDIGVPGAGSLEAIRLLRAASSRRPGIIILSGHDDPHFIQAALQAGASGYLLKSTGCHDLLDAIRQVGRGNRYLNHSISGLEQDLHACDACPAGLTNRERQVLQLLADGHDTKQAALALHLSVKTVHTFRSRLMEKLQVHNIAELTKFAIRCGLASL